MNYLGYEVEALAIRAALPLLVRQRQALAVALALGMQVASRQSPSLQSKVAVRQEHRLVEQAAAVASVVAYLVAAVAFLSHLP